MKIVKKTIMYDFENMKYSKLITNSDWKFMIHNVSDPIWYSLGWWEDTSNLWIFQLGE